MSCHQHGYSWPSLATSPYRSSPLAALQGYIPYPHIAAVVLNFPKQTTLENKAITIWMKGATITIPFESFIFNWV